MFDEKWNEGRNCGRYCDCIKDDRENRRYGCRERFRCNQCDGWNRKCGCQHISVRSFNRCQYDDFNRHGYRGNHCYVDGRKKNYQDNHFEEDRDFCTNYRSDDYSVY